MKRRTFGKVLVTASVIVSSCFLFASSTLAAVRCETQYGGGQTCVTTGQIQVNKKVWDPGSKLFVDNLVASGVHHFVSGETVTFTVRIQNVGDTRIDNVIFTDTLPTFLKYASGNLSENLGSLAPGQFVDRTITAVVVASNQLPLSPSTVCDGRTTNFAEARNDDSSDRDNSEVCVDNRVLGKVTPTPVKVIPLTGPEHLAFLGLGIAGAMGIYLRKFKLI